MKANPLNYDAWFDYIRLLEADANTEQVRDTYERAIANIPPSKVKFTNFFYLNNVSFDLFPVSNVFGDINKIKFYILVIYRLKFLKLEFYLVFFYCRKNVTGVDTFTCGLITHCMRSWRRRIWRGPGTSIKPAWTSFLTKTSPLPKSGFYSLTLKSDRKIYRVQEEFWYEIISLAILFHWSYIV